jgi:hydrogenase maturation protease
LQVGDQVFHAWQEAEERRVELAGVAVSEIVNRPRLERFSLPGRRRTEPLPGPDGEFVGVLVREQRAVEGAIELVAADAADGLFRVTLRVINGTALEDDQRADRDAALLRTLVSTHAVLKVRDGAFVSLLDPPETWRQAAAACRNVGTWPVLVGEEGDTDTLLSSPIILYDYPQLAPESPGDLFDATEIDEILTLRILTLTDEEKRSAGGLDGRTRELLARTEALAREQLSALHGTLRNPRQTSGGRA